MGFREDIPMDGFVQSNPVLADGFGWTNASTAMRTAVRPAPHDEVEDYYPLPASVSRGAQTRSTSLELEVWPSIVWDVNGYYRTLGVSFRADRRQLLAAYHRLNGQEDAYITYVFKQLLDPVVRRQYDACPLGDLFLDRYVEEALKRRANELARRFGMTAEKVMAGWGFKVVKEEPGSEAIPERKNNPLEPDNPLDEDPVDIPQKSGEDEPVPVTRSEPWPYSFYLWRLRRKDRWFSDVDAMRRWQEAIAAECYRRGKAVTFAVGVMGQRMGPEPRVMSADGARVALIAIDQLDRIDQLAPVAVDRLTTLRD